VGVRHFGDFRLKLWLMEAQDRGKKGIGGFSGDEVDVLAQI
jgi:hypothetical protein